MGLIPVDHLWRKWETFVLSGREEEERRETYGRERRRAKERRGFYPERNWV